MQIARRSALGVVLLTTIVLCLALPLPDRAEGAVPADVAKATGRQPAVPTRAPNLLGVIPVLEYHLIGDSDGRWSRSHRRFARDLELLHVRGYRPITVRQLVTKRIDVAPGMTPVVITFDDASPGQFRFVASGDSVLVDPTSALGIWEAFAAKHAEWKGRAVFCVLPSASNGHAFFGDKGIQGQRSAWRLQKVRYLAEGGYELCNHTLWHANLSKMSGALVQEQIARAQLAVDSGMAGYRMRTLALPLGIWPKNRSLLLRGAWRDATNGRTTAYQIDAVLRVGGGPSPSPFDTLFDPLRIPRVQVFANELETLLDQLDRRGTRYVAARRQ